MSDMIESLGVSYPATWQEEEPRRLAQLSQTNITPDHGQGFAYAAAAYDRGLEPDVAQDDPTLAGEAAAKAALRSTQYGATYDVSEAWLQRSFNTLTPLSGEAPSLAARMRRERIASLILAGRSRGLRLINLETSDGPDSSTLAAKLEPDALTSFRRANDSLLSSHIISGNRNKWDPYATMNSAHFGAFEAVRPGGNGKEAVKLGYQCVVQALRSLPEESNVNKPLTPRQRLVRNAEFVAKHAALGATVMAMGVRRQLSDRFPAKVTTDKTRRLALKILG